MTTNPRVFMFRNSWFQPLISQAITFRHYFTPVLYTSTFGGSECPWSESPFDQESFRMAVDQQIQVKVSRSGYVDNALLKACGMKGACQTSRGQGFPENEGRVQAPASEEQIDRSDNLSRLHQDKNLVLHRQYP